jgi:hypothetical protein
MTWNHRVIIFGAIAATVVSADRVVLVDGQIFEGRILSETKYEVEIETARNAARTLRTVQIINREAVKALSRGGEAVAVLPDVALPQVDPAEPEAEALDITGAHNWLESSTGLLEAGKYDEALDLFKQVANDPRLVEQSRMHTPEARSALELRIRSYKLWITAVKGKREYLEAQSDEKEEEADLRLDRAKERLRDYQKKQRYREDEKSNTSLRSKQRRTVDPEVALIGQVDRARKSLDEFESWNRKNTLTIQNLESEYDLLREQLKQIERELKALRKK